MIKGRILRDIEDERAAQDAKHGGPANDAEHTFFVWVAIFADHLGRLARSIWSGNTIAYRYQLVRIAAIAIAALEAFDRNRGREVETLRSENAELRGIVDHFDQPK